MTGFAKVQGAHLRMLADLARCPFHQDFPRPGIETVFMMPAETYSYVSSRLVTEVFQLGGAISGLVPPSRETRMKEKLDRPR